MTGYVSEVVLGQEPTSPLQKHVLRLQKGYQTEKIAPKSALPFGYCIENLAIQPTITVRLLTKTLFS